MDTTRALALNAANPKARHRRAQALQGMGRLQDALRQYHSVLEVLPSHMGVMSEIAALQEQISATQQQPAAPSSTAPPPTPSATKRKVVVEETSGSDSDDELLTSNPSSKAASTAASSPKPAAAAVSDAKAKAAAPAAVQVSASPAAAPSSSSSTSPTTPAAGLHKAAAAKAAAAIASLASKLPPTPKSAVDVERACKLLADSPDMLRQYVRSVDPDSYKGVFKESLTPILIGQLASGYRLLVASEPDFVLSALGKLTGVSRFTMMSMSLGKADKQAVRDVFTALDLAGKVVSPVKKLYRV